MRPRIICHMLSSIDGKIDGAALAEVTRKGEYEETGAALEGDAWLCGRTTMQQHFAEKEPFVSAFNRPAGPHPVFVARRASSYAVSVDTLGKLRWRGAELDGDHLICVVSEQAPEDYLAMLRKIGISYIIAGQGSVNLDKAVFDGINRSQETAVPLKLKSVEQRDSGPLWIRYEAVQSS